MIENNSESTKSHFDTIDIRPKKKKKKDHVMLPHATTMRTLISNHMEDHFRELNITFKGCLAKHGHENRVPYTRRLRQHNMYILVKVKH